MPQIVRLGGAFLAVTALASALGGCYVAPRRGYYYQQPTATYVQPAQPVYVQPARPAVYVQPARPVYVAPAVSGTVYVGPR